LEKLGWVIECGPPCKITKSGGRLFCTPFSRLLQRAFLMEVFLRETKMASNGCIAPVNSRKHFISNVTLQSYVGKIKEV